MNARVVVFTRHLSAGVSEHPTAIRRLVIQFRRNLTQSALKVLSQQSALSTNQTNETTHSLRTLAPSG